MSNEADQQSASTSQSADEAEVRALYHRRNCDARQNQLRRLEPDRIVGRHSDGREHVGLPQRNYHPGQTAEHILAVMFFIA